MLSLSEHTLDYDTEQISLNMTKQMMVIVRDGETDSGMTIVSTLNKTRNEQIDPMDEVDGYSKYKILNLSLIHI